MIESWYLDAVWISVAFAGGMVARRINLPPLVGFLVAGFILNFVGFTSGGVGLEAASDLGVMLLLFTIGLKLNLRSLLSPEIWLTTSLQMVIMTVIFGLLIFLLSFTGLQFMAGIDTVTALVIGFTLSFSSTVFAVKILEDRGEVGSFHGRISIGILVMQDIIAVIFLSLSGESKITLWLLALPIYLLVIRWVLFKLLDAVDHGELFTLFGFFAAFVTGAISFKLFGLKADLGALVLGAMIAPHERSKELARHMMGYKDFFLVAFFLMIGLHGLPNWENLIVAMILAVMVFFKGGLFLYILTRLKLRARTSWFASLSLSTYSEFGLIVAAIGYQQQIINPEWMVVIAMALSFSFFIGSPLNASAHALLNRFRPQITMLNKHCEHPDDEIRDLGDAEYLICGMGRIGRVVYHFLHGQYGDKVIAIDYDFENVERLRSANKNVFWGDATDGAFWQHVNTEKIKLIFIAMTDHKTNMNVAREISLLNERNFLTGSTSRYRDEFLDLKGMGIDFVYNYYDRLGADFADRFVKYSENKTEDLPIET